MTFWASAYFLDHSDQNTSTALTKSWLDLLLFNPASRQFQVRLWILKSGRLAHIQLFAETSLSLQPSFPQPRPLVLIPDYTCSEFKSKSKLTDASTRFPPPQNDSIPRWSQVVNISCLETYFLPQYPPNGGSWGPSQSVHQSSNQSVHQLTSKLLMDWLLKGRGCGFQFSPTLRRSADCSNSSEFNKMPSLPPSPFFFPTHPIHPPVHRSISPFALPLLSAASRHQVDGLLQFVPQFVFATVPIPIQRRQDLQRQRKEIIPVPTRV